jgi:hypothetical protein
MTSSGRPAAYLLGAAMAACCAGLVAACSSPASSTPRSSAGQPGASSAPAATPAGSGSVSGSGSPAQGGAGQAGPPPCATSALRASMPAIGNAASGHSGYPVNLTNDSSASCTLNGYPGVSFVTGAGGTQIGAAAARATTSYLFTAQPPQAITLAPGQTAHADLQLVTAGNFSPSQCGLVTAHWVRVYPPNQTAPLYVNFTAQTCSKALNLLTVSPVQPVGAPNP